MTLETVEMTVPTNPGLLRRSASYPGNRWALRRNDDERHGLP